MRLRILIAALAVTATALLTFALTGTGALDIGQRKAVEEVVRAYLQENPEVVIEAIRAFQA